MNAVMEIMNRNGAAEELANARREAVREFKRTLIREAAKRIFVERGIEAASMREIAHAAGYSTGLIYVYFETKEDLYAEILRDSLEAQYRSLCQALLAKRTRRAETALRSVWAFYQSRPADFELGFYLYGGLRRAGLTHQLDDELNQMLDRVMDTIGACLIDDGLADESNAHHRAVLHTTTLFGLLLMQRTGRLRSVNERAAPMLESILKRVAMCEQSTSGTKTDD